jgi:hypothetical protein
MKERIDYDTYGKIWKTFADAIVEELIKTGATFKMPNGLGTLTVYKKKTKRGKMVDYNKTKQLGYTVYHNNYHSDQYYAYFDWDTYHKCKTIFKLRMNRRHKRYLTKCIKENNAINTYFEKE